MHLIGRSEARSRAGARTRHGSLVKGVASRRWVSLACALVICTGWRTVRGQSTNSATDAATSRYEFRQEHDPNGIGKFYLGREIAQVMGHQAADWLERPEREAEEKPGLLLEALGIKAGEAVADIGAGSGYYSRRLAKLVGEGGLVYAVDIQPEMLDLLTNKMAELNIRNVKAVLGTLTDPNLPPNSIDLVLMVDVYHEFDHPYEMVQALCTALKPGGRIVLVEFRGEDPKVPIKRLHKMTETQVRKELADAPLRWVQTIETMPRQHIIVFRKN
ncbi:Methyltransferase type 11 (modular protein) [Verrucomicrobia bacterium]|nr:Methyltransferase type 11 (modular protein) [Verrucomicrobiota bacterium]